MQDKEWQFIQASQRNYPAFFSAYLGWICVSPVSGTMLEVGNRILLNVRETNEMGPLFPGEEE